MFDHLLGRPSPAWKRSQALLVIVFWVWRLVKGNPGGPRILWLRRLNRALERFTPWQLIVSTCSILYAVRNMDSILGLGSPEPLQRLYSPSYYRATWIVTAFDAGFATAMSIRPKFLRDIFSMLFTGYYLLYAREADEKLRRFRAVCTVELLRVTWNKTSNPYIRAFTYFDRPRIPIVRHILLPRPAGSPHKKPISAWIFFSRSEKELAWATDLILDFPGGGFICMNPTHHEERLRRWAIRTGKVVLAIDYGKAPEYPYPWAIEEGFDAYRVLTESKGRAIGMSGSALNIIMSGDSAGGNLVATIMYKILENPTPLPRPIGLVFAYPALDFNFTSWMTPSNLSVLKHEQSSVHIAGLAEVKDHLAHKSPLSVVRDVGERRLRMRRSWRRSLSGTFRRVGGSIVSDTTSISTADSRPETAASSPVSSAPPSPPVMRSFKSRLQDRVDGLDQLAVDTNVLHYDPTIDEDDDDYYPLAEEDKPISARILYPNNADLVKAQQKELSEAVAIAETRAANVKKVPIKTRLTMTSRTGYFQDRIISPSMMRAMAILYIGPANPDFGTDYYISPILGPASLLSQFPPILMLCGEKDPFVDDTVIFAGRLREAKRTRKEEIRTQLHVKFGEGLRMSAAGGNAASKEREREKLLAEKEDDWVDMRILEGWGHGFLQMPAMLPESRSVIHEMADWIGDSFAKNKAAIAVRSPPPAVGVTQPKRGALPPLPSVANGSSTPTRASSGARSSSPAPRSRSPFVVPPLPVEIGRRGSSSTNKARPNLLASSPITSADLSHPMSSETETETEKEELLTFRPRKNRSPPTSTSAGSKDVVFVNGSHSSSSSAETIGGIIPSTLRPDEDKTPRRPSFRDEKDRRAAAVALKNSLKDSVIAPSLSSAESQRRAPASFPSPTQQTHDIVGTFTPPVVSPSNPTPTTPKSSMFLTEAELLRRRRVDAVFGLGDSGSVVPSDEEHDGSRKKKITSRMLREDSSTSDVDPNALGI